jgi:hypothetical protein
MISNGFMGMTAHISSHRIAEPIAHHVDRERRYRGET